MKTCYNCFHELGDTVRICPSCGMGADISNAAQYPHALPCGSVLAGRYVTGRVLGQGGFGITYVAQNYNTKELAAIKEYYPDSMAIREGSHSVTPYNMDRSSNYEYGKERFLEEAKTLSEFIGNPHIVRVISYFEENGTAYFVMEYVKGISLKKYLQGKGGKISWQEAMQLLKPVMDALSAVHDKGIIHRDVTPDNIVITDDGNVKLLDFGSARYSIGERSQSLDVILKHGFAPYEQYIRRSRQGSFTDVYSLAATFYYAITGLTPPEAVERIDNDTLQLPSALGIDIPAGVEAALVKALAVRSNDRIRTMDEFKKALEEGADSSRCKISAHGSDTAGYGSHDPGKTAGGIPPFGQKIPENVEDVEDVETGNNNRTAASPSAECNTTEKDTAAQDTASQNRTEQNKTKQGTADQNTTVREKEIDLTEYARNNEGKNGGNGGTSHQKKIPKWLIPAAAAVLLAFLVIYLTARNRSSTGGTDASAGTTGQNIAEEVDKGEGTGESGLSPEMEVLLARANSGDAGAQYELGNNYLNGTGVEQNYDEALAWYTKAAELGNTDAQYDLGEMYHNGTGTDKDDSKAAKYYRQAADNGHASAQCRYGVMLQSGEGEEKDEEEAVEWFRKAADQEYPEGEYLLGLAYFDGQGVDQDYDKAYGVFLPSAEQDYPEAQNMLGNCMKAGIGTDQDFEGAFSWYEKAAQHGLPEAQFNLAETYAAGRGVDQSYEQAAEWYSSAAEQGLARAQTNLGVLYANGKGVSQSEEEAFNLFEKAAEQGDPAGQLDLAYMYLTGTGTEQDYEAALAWLKKVTEYDNGEEAAVAIATIAEIYAEGNGVEKNEEEAAAWQEKEGYDSSAQPLPDVFDSTRLSAKEPEYSDDPYFCLFCGAYLGSKAELQSEASEVQKYIMDGWEFAEAPVTACCGKQFDPDGKDYLDYLNSMLNDDYEDEDQGFPRPPSEKGESEHNHKWD